MHSNIFPPILHKYHATCVFGPVNQRREREKERARPRINRRRHRHLRISFKLESGA